MKTEIIKEFDIDKIKEEKDATLVLGLFDGIHKGHQFLIKEALKNNDNVIILSLLKSFKNNEDVLLSLEDKEEILSSFNIKKLILLDNSLYFKNMTYLDFILKILKIINPKNIYVGSDYTFGRNGLGNVSILKKYFKVFTPNFYLVNNEKVSSTKIKEYIRNGLKTVGPKFKFRACQIIRDDLIEQYKLVRISNNLPYYFFAYP